MDDGSLLVAGWKEWVSLPDLGVDWVKAKLDTGARSSALHAGDIERVTHDGVDHVAFELHPWQHSDLDAQRVELPLIDERLIRSSTGHTEQRFVVRTRLRIGEIEFSTELTLTNRDSMGLRMLVGRQALRHRVLVDSARSYATGRPPREVRARNRVRGR